MINFTHEEAMEIINSHAEKLMLEYNALLEKEPNLQYIVAGGSDTFLTVKMGSPVTMMAQEELPHKIRVKVLELKDKDAFIEVVKQLFQSYYYRYHKLDKEEDFSDTEDDILCLVETAGYYTPNTLLSKSNAELLCFKDKIRKVPQDWLPEKYRGSEYYVSPHVKNRNMLPISIVIP